MCFSLGQCDGGWVVVSSFRVMMIGDYYFFLLIIAHFLCPACALAGWLSWLSPHVYVVALSEDRQQLLDGTERASDIIRLTTHPFA